LWASVVGTLASGVCSFPAGAATVVGEAFIPPPPDSPEQILCPAPSTWVQAASPSPSYVIPADGVITSWSVGSGEHHPYLGPVNPVTLKILFPGAAEGYYTVAGSSGPENAVENTVQTFAARVPVRAGSVLGFSVQGVTYCARYLGVGEFAAGFIDADAPVGSASPFILEPVRLPVSVTVEPDADRDGFGDETQDGCPGDPTTLGACPDKIAPDTRITKKPKKKSKSKRARFEFASTEPGSSFECALDGNRFRPCESPHTVRVRKGRHTFEVRAIDAAGNVDPQPAGYRWKVKKKKKRR